MTAEIKKLYSLPPPKFRIYGVCYCGSEDFKLILEGDTVIGLECSQCGATTECDL
jgi:translation initiation factor 2 beta subunit (eIF-2beta)/eIF-5